MAKKLVKMDDDRKMGEKVNDNMILGESHFARGLIIKPSTRIQKPTKGIPAGRSMELITSLKEAGYMTLSSVSIAMQCNRQKSKTFLNKLHSAGLVEYSEIVTERGIFGLWQISGTTKPLNAQEGCRLATLSIFYALIRNEVKHFQWRLFRNKENGLIMAEMGFWNSEGSAKWIIDVPRKGEQKVDTADLYIFPDLREAKIKTPAGKLYIADNVLFNIKPIELRGRIILKKA